MFHTYSVPGSVLVFKIPLDCTETGNQLQDLGFQERRGKNNAFRKPASETASYSFYITHAPVGLISCYSFQVGGRGLSVSTLQWDHSGPEMTPLAKVTRVPGSAFFFFCSSGPSSHLVWLRVVECLLCLLFQLWPLEQCLAQDKHSVIRYGKKK